MKTILRNFLSVLRRLKMATSLNILGLSIAFASFMVILMQLDFDYHFDRMHPESDRIFRVERVWDTAASPPFSRPLAEAFMKSSPHIVSGALVSTRMTNKEYLSVESPDGKRFYEEAVINAYPTYVDVFGFRFTEGTGKALEDPEKVLIPAGMAMKFFGNQPAIGKLLKSGEQTYTVGAVYADFPDNSCIKNPIIKQIPPLENIDRWDNNSYYFYVKLDDPAYAGEITKHFKETFDAAALGSRLAWVGLADYRLTLVTDTHFVQDTSHDYTAKSSRPTLLILLAIAFVIILIAGINFTNFSMALTPIRIKSVNTQKVLGGDDATIRFSLLAEAMSISLISYLLALGILYLLPLSTVETLVNADLAPAAHPLIVGGTALLALATGLLAGLYPSWYITSFSPAWVLKGSFGLSPKGRQLRNLLIGFQFIASFALVIGASFIYLQNRYMHRSALGYDKDQLIVTNIPQSINENREAFVSRTKAFAGIEEVALAEQLISSADQYGGWGRIYRGKDILYDCLYVDDAFLRTAGIPVTEGRDFLPEDKLKRHGALIYNECARKKYGLEIGGMVDSMEIVGFMPDVKFASFRKEVEPMAFYVWGEVNWGTSPKFAYVRVKGGTDMHAAMTHINASLQAIDPDYPYDVRFYDNVLNQTYIKEQQTGALITLFSFIAIFISIVGVFGLVVFESEFRKKEIGIRKVLGSTTEEILLLFNKTYVRILCVCFVLAAPIAWYAIVRWLENFAYKTPIYWWVFLLSFICISLITLLTVTFQNWWTANENPVKSIKTE